MAVAEKEKENVYMAIIVVAVLVFAVLIYLCSMSGYTTKRKNPNDYMEINKRQRDKDMSKIKAQDEYDNKWGML